LQPAIGIVVGGGAGRKSLRLPRRVLQAPCRSGRARRGRASICSRSRIRRRGRFRDSSVVWIELDSRFVLAIVAPIASNGRQFSGCWKVGANLQASVTPRAVHGRYDVDIHLSIPEAHWARFGTQCCNKRRTPIAKTGVPGPLLSRSLQPTAPRQAADAAASMPPLPGLSSTVRTPQAL